MSTPLQPIKLTSFSHGGGCGCKIAPGVLAEILRSSSGFPVPKELMVGIETADDAAVGRLRAGGSLDPTFATNGVARIDVADGTDAAHGIARQPNGKIVGAGETWRKGVPRFLVIRLTA